MDNSKIVNALRKVWLFSPERRDAIKASKTVGGYKCYVCGGIIPNQKLVKVDHIEQVRASGWDWNLFVERLFCPSEGLQVLCKECHDMKSRKERELASMIKYGEQLNTLLFFFKCLYYRQTFIHREWDDYTVTDEQYDMLENCLRRVSEATKKEFSVLSYVGFYMSDLLTKKIAYMCERPIGAHEFYDEELERIYNKFISKKKKVKKLKY